MVRLSRYLRNLIHYILKGIIYEFINYRGDNGCNDFGKCKLTPKVTAETGVGNDVFKVVVILFGITNSIKDITTLVNVKDESKVKVFNADKPEREDKDTITYTTTFQICK